jgi:hypothetical protein
MVREFMKLLAPATQIGINNSPPTKRELIRIQITNTYPKYTYGGKK